MYALFDLAANLDADGHGKNGRTQAEPSAEPPTGEILCHFIFKRKSILLIFSFICFLENQKLITSLQILNCNILESNVNLCIKNVM